MLSVLDIILISIGSLAVVLYTTFKILQLVKYKKLVKQYMTQGITEAEAKYMANKQTYLKSKKHSESNEDDIYDE